MTLFTSPETRAAERHALVNRAVISHLGGFADHCAHTVVNENTASDFCPRMNLDPGEKPGHMTHPASKGVPALDPAPVTQPPELHRVKPGIGEKHFMRAVARRVSLPDDLDIFSHSLKHGNQSLRFWQDPPILPDFFTRV